MWHRHRHRHPREDRRENVRVGVGVGVVEFQLLSPLFDQASPAARYCSYTSAVRISVRRRTTAIFCPFICCKLAPIMIIFAARHPTARHIRHGNGEIITAIKFDLFPYIQRLWCYASVSHTSSWAANITRVCGLCLPHQNLSGVTNLTLTQTEIKIGLLI